MTSFHLALPRDSTSEEDRFSHDHRPHLGLPPSLAHVKKNPHASRIFKRACRKIECEHGRSICPKEPLIFGRRTPTIFVLVENYI